MFELLGASIELVRIHAGAYGAHNRTTALLDRETGPDLSHLSDLIGRGLW